jgi:DNA-binding MarR family transcriptional regulator
LVLHYSGMNETATVSAPMLTVEVLRTLSALEERLEAALEPHGLSLAKLGALSKLAAAGEPVPLGTLAERLSCVRSNITQLVDRLESEKLVVRSDDPRDRRSVRAELTPQGKARHATGMRALEKAERQILSRLTSKEQNDLVRLLSILRGEG